MKDVKTYLLLKIFNDFSIEDLHFLAKRTNCLSIKQNKPLFISGESSKFLYAVLSGSLKITREDSSGHVIITRIVGPTKMVGLREFFENYTYSRSCFALEDTEILAIHHDSIMTLMKKNAKVSLHFIALFSNELTRMEEMLESYMNRSAKKRLSAIIYEFFEMFSTKNSNDFKSPLKRKDIAELAGMTPETVSRILYHLKKAKILETTGKYFKVLDPKALKNYDE